MEEIWKDIKDYKGMYQVSNLGRVKSLDRLAKYGRKTSEFKHIKGIILKPVKNHGYLRVQLNKEGKGRYYRIHRLVSLAFIPNPENKPIPNHINGIKTDNRINNLEWNTHSENNKHAYNTGLRVGAMTGRIGGKNPLSIKVCQYDKDDNLIETFAAMAEAHRKTGISTGDISKCGNGKIKSAGGFIWRKEVSYEQ